MAGRSTQSLDCMRATLPALGYLLLAVACTFAGCAFSEHLAVDSCLDRGGSFDYVRTVCDTAGSHPYEPDYLYWLLAFGAGVAGLFALLVGRQKGAHAI